MEMSGNAAVIGQFLEAVDQGDIDTLRNLAHPDIVMFWPQSGERFSGIDNALGALSVQEVKPEMAGEPRVTGADDTWVVMMPLRYGEDVYHYVGVFELDSGRIRRSTEFFGAPFPAQEGRAKFTDKG